MTKKVLAVLGVAVFAAACSEGPTAFAPEDATIGVASPGTAVSAGFVIAGVSDTITNGPGIKIDEDGTETDHGTCHAGGAWKNPGGNFSGNVPHAHCLTTTGGIEVEFAVAANYVEPKSGNIHLNFSVCGYEEDEEGNLLEIECLIPTHIHYHKNQDRTSASGVITSLDGAWTIDLSQVSTERNGGSAFDGRSVGPFTATNGDGGSGVATLTW